MMKIIKKLRKDPSLYGLLIGGLIFSSQIINDSCFDTRPIPSPDITKYEILTNKLNESIKLKTLVNNYNLIDRVNELYQEKISFETNTFLERKKEYENKLKNYTIKGVLVLTLGGIIMLGGLFYHLNNITNKS